MLCDSLRESGINREESLLRSPVELLDVMSTEGIDHGSNTWGAPSTRIIKVQHPLDSTGLQSIDQAAGGIIERPVPRSRTRLALLIKTDDLVVGLDAGSVGADGTNFTTSGLDLGRMDIGRRGTGCGRRNRNGNPTFLASALVLHAQSKRDDIRNVRLGTVNLDRDAQALTQETHGLETFLVVGSTTTDEDADGVSDELVLIFFEGADNTLERGGDVCEIGNTTADDEDFAVRAGSTAGDKVDWR